MRNPTTPSSPRVITFPGRNNLPSLLDMNKALLLTVLLLASPFSPAFANLLVNADFEASPTEDEKYPFYKTPQWYNPAPTGNKAQGETARVREHSLQGSAYSATVNNREQETSAFMQKTAHSIKDGEEIELSLEWTAGWKWKSEDLLRVVVFAKSDNTLAGATIWEDMVDFQYAQKGTWEKKKHTFRPAPPEAAGKTLYFSFYGVDPQRGGLIGWCRVDNINLTVKPK